MKKILLSFVLCLVGCWAYGACEQTGTKYIACKPGLYLDSGNCELCPDFSGGWDAITYVYLQGTSADKNNGGITDCYMPKNMEIADDHGVFVFEENCSYGA